MNPSDAAAGQALMSFEAVDFTYPGAAAPVIRNFSAAVAPGAFVSVCGPSGSGKSTLLRLACRLEAPDRGRICFQGVPVETIAPPVLRRQSCYVQQTPTLVEGSVRHNLLLAFGFRINAQRPAPDDDRLRMRLAEFKLDALSLDQNARGLSVGQQQRLCILRAMLLDPPLLLLDEPTSALDADNARRVRETLTRLNRDQGVTLMMVSHNELDSRHATAEIRMGSEP